MFILLKCLFLILWNQIGLKLQLSVWGCIWILCKAYILFCCLVNGHKKCAVILFSDEIVCLTMVAFKLFVLCLVLFFTRGDIFAKFRTWIPSSLTRTLHRNFCTSNGVNRKCLPVLFQHGYYKCEFVDMKMVSQRVKMS